MKAQLLFVALAAAVCEALIFPMFPNSVFSTDISSAALDPESAETISWLTTNGGFGAGGVLRTDFSIEMMTADCSTPRVPVTKRSGYYDPDCDDISEFPLPTGGRIEGQSGYTCDYVHNDCHLLVVDTATNLLYESYSSTVVSGSLSSICVIVWDLEMEYPSNLRGEQCTSCDAAGFPIAPLLFTADEIHAGVINHAIRFILPNPRMRRKRYVHPASHAGAPSANETTTKAPIYGARFRLKASFDDSALPASTRVVTTALKKYGMLLSDGGNIALTAQSDTFTTYKWDDVGFDSQSLLSIGSDAFEVVAPLDSSARFVLTYDCVRNFDMPTRTCGTSSVSSTGGGGSSGNSTTGNGAARTIGGSITIWLMTSLLSIVLMIISNKAQE